MFTKHKFKASNLIQTGGKIIDNILALSQILQNFE